MKKTKLQWMTAWIFLSLAGFLVMSGYAMEFPEITAEKLKTKMDTGEKLLLVNPLSEIEFAANHIPGSINIPLPNILITDKLPKDKKQLIVTYCLGPNCTASVEAARLAAKRGYTNIKVFREGIPGWTNAGFSINKGSKKKELVIPEMDSYQLNTDLDQYLIIDIRPASIYNFGYLPNSHAIPLPYLSMLSSELPKDRKIVVVDHSGKQSQKAAQWLINNGFKDVSILKDGLSAYSKAGFTLEK